MDTALTPQQHYEKALLYFPGAFDYYVHMITAANQGHVEAQKRFLFGFTMTDINLLIEARRNPSLIREKIICSDEIFRLIRQLCKLNYFEIHSKNFRENPMFCFR